MMKKNRWLQPYLHSTLTLLAIAGLFFLQPSTLKGADSIPLRGEETRIVVSEPYLHLGEAVQRTIAELHGLEIPIVEDREVQEEDWSRYHMIAIGNLSTNQIIARLYADHKVFLDAVFPGEGGHFVKTVVDPFGKGRNFIVAGGSDDEGTGEAVQRLIEFIEEGSQELNQVHSIESGLINIETPAASELEERIEREIGLFADSRGTGALNRAMQAGMNYYFTDEPIWLELFKAPLLYFIESAREAEDWFFAPRLSFYFALGPIIETWSLIEDSPHLSSEEREVLTDAFFELGQYLSRSSYLPPERSPAGEPRQNHPTFAALSLDAMARYFGRRGENVESWRQTTDRLFDGQVETYRSDDDAGHYTWYSPIHSFVYYMRRDPSRVMEGDMMSRLGKLGILLMNNRREEIMFGDKRTYGSWESSSWSRYLGPVFSNAWFVTKDPAFAWAYRHTTEGKTPPPGIQRPLNNLLYAVPMPGETPPPADYLGITSLLLDEVPLQWISTRVWDQAWIPDQGKQYLDKLTMRPSFDPQDEYLSMDGTSAFSHGHEDANSILQLTWKDRIWLQTMDYIRSKPRFQNSIEIARDGRTSISPPFAVLEAEEDFRSMGMIRSTLESYNGLDWSRNIVWLKNRYFVVLDELTARESGTYDLQARWSLLGDPELQGRELTVTQEGARFRMINADDSRPTLYRPPLAQNEWGNYEYAGPEEHVFRQRMKPVLAAGESAHFMNLFYATEEEGETNARRFTRLDPALTVVEEEGRVALMGLAPEPKEIAGLTLQTDLFYLDDEGLHAVNLTLLENEEMMLSANQPVALSTVENRLILQKRTQLRLKGAELEGVEGTRLNGSTIYQLDPGEYGIETGVLPSGEVLQRLSARAMEPAIPEPSKPVGFRFIQESIRPLGSAVSAMIQDPDRKDVWWMGLEDGRLLHTGPDGEIQEIGRVNGGVRSIVTSTLDGEPVLFVGDEEAAITAFDYSGQQRWKKQLTSNRGRTERIVEMKILTKNHEPRLVAVTEAARVHVLYPDGSYDWMDAFKYHAATQLIITDLDGDGEEDIVIGNEYHTPIYVFDSNGNEIWMAWEQVGSEARSTTPFLGTHAMSLAVEELKPGEGSSILLGNETDDLFSIRPDGEEVFWHANVGGEVRTLAVTDLTGDNSKDVIVGTGSGMVQALDSEGERLWWRAFDSDITSLKEVRVEGIDLNPLLGFSTRDGRVGLLDLEGRLVGLEWMGSPVRDLHVLEEGRSLLVVTDDARLIRLLWQPPRSVYGPQYRTSRHRY